ncbi:MAG: VOC family protein [Syntrophaceae bacterium]|nr:VOC family protein [Syntrophaceae bacterium]
MKMEHVALNVADPIAMASWYREHLGFEIAKGMTTPPYTHFLREATGLMMIEIYHNPPDQVPSYAEMDPLLLHLAFVSKDPEADKSRLLEAGATLVKDEQLADGSRLAMLRDPWGLPIQLCRRSAPLLKFK